MNIDVLIWIIPSIVLIAGLSWLVSYRIHAGRPLQVYKGGHWAEWFLGFGVYEIIFVDDKTGIVYLKHVYSPYRSMIRRFAEKTGFNFLKLIDNDSNSPRICQFVEIPEAFKNARGFVRLDSKFPNYTTNVWTPTTF